MEHDLNPKPKSIIWCLIYNTWVSVICLQLRKGVKKAFRSFGVLQLSRVAHYHVTVLVRPSLLKVVLRHMLPALRNYCSIWGPNAERPRRCLPCPPLPLQVQGTGCHHLASLKHENGEGYRASCLMRVNNSDFKSVKETRKPKFCLTRIYGCSTYHWFSSSSAPKGVSENVLRHFQLSQCVCVICGEGV